MQNNTISSLRNVRGRKQFVKGTRSVPENYKFSYGSRIDNKSITTTDPRHTAMNRQASDKISDKDVLYLANGTDKLNWLLTLIKNACLFIVHNLTYFYYQLISSILFQKRKYHTFWLEYWLWKIHWIKKGKEGYNCCKIYDIQSEQS